MIAERTFCLLSELGVGGWGRGLWNCVWITFATDVGLSYVLFHSFTCCQRPRPFNQSWQNWILPLWWKVEIMKHPSLHSTPPSIKCVVPQRYFDSDKKFIIFLIENVRIIDWHLWIHTPQSTHSLSTGVKLTKLSLGMTPGLCAVYECFLPNSVEHHLKLGSPLVCGP